MLVIILQYIGHPHLPCIPALLHQMIIANITNCYVVERQSHDG